jgi:hypothetical protein
MPRDERERVLAQLAELRHTLQRTRSEDLREALLQGISECEQRLAELDAQLGAHAVPAAR